jgi:hypothetical protein
MCRRLEIWRPLIAKACVQVMNENFRKIGFEAMYFFNHHFYKKKACARK